MKSGFQKITICGRVGADAEVRKIQNGSKVVNFNVATSESWTDKASGQEQKWTEWHRVTSFNPAFVKLGEDHIKKGTLLIVEGRIRSRSYEKDGQPVQTKEVMADEIVLLARPNGNNNNAQPAVKNDQGDDIPY